MTNSLDWFIFASFTCLIVVSAEEQSCLEKLRTSPIEDADCVPDDVDRFNNVKLYPLLRRLLEKNYFRFYNVNLKKTCQFWPSDDTCSASGCHVEPCKPEELPKGLAEENLNHNNARSEHPAYKYTKEAQETKSGEECVDHLIDRTVSAENQEAFKTWKNYDEKFCLIEDDCVGPDSIYVDLQLNPEKFTGYVGESASKIWRLIYEENCFKVSPDPFSRQQCIEERTFYRLISGLHTSISVGVLANYLVFDKLTFQKKWEHNVQGFKKRYNCTAFPAAIDYLKNMYFSYLIELAALAKLSPFIRKEVFYTGDEDDDMDTREIIDSFTDVVASFEHHFDETKLFQGEKSHELKREFHRHFLNISRIMDCVGCEKCKIWGKLQTKGMGVALKVLFSKQIQCLDPDLGCDFALQRAELVALFNAFGRLSTNIFELENFRRAMR